MSNNSSLQLCQPLNLNKLYSHLNYNYQYFFSHFRSMVPYFLQFNLSMGLITCMSFIQKLFIQNTMFKILTINTAPFVFFKQNINKTRKVNSINKLRTLFKTKESIRTNLMKRTSPNYVYNKQFNSYKRNFLTSSIPLISPFIRKKSRIFPFYSKGFTKKILKTQRLKRKIFHHRKF